MEQKLMAFWGDVHSFPSVLCGEITKFNDTGSVETKEYGKGYGFYPKKILPYESGEVIKEKLLKIRSDYLEAKAALDKKYRQEMRKIAPWNCL